MKTTKTDPTSSSSAKSSAGLPSFAEASEMARRGARKIYCYVDETGQDTNGDLFIVAIVLAGAQKDQMEKKLLEIENKSAKGIRKWQKSIIALAELMLSSFKEQKISVTIDALTKNQRKIVAVELRHFGIMTDVVRGKRDESSAFLRLADALAGFARDGVENQKEYKNIFNRAVKDEIIKKIE
ncbi:MAG: DUF3800 domain-containing protein [Candidatus Berkelbacteria bacterium]|nr:DUF3800 domain-containing protein [Candidatus Berkelbacteria bacterium]